MMQHEPVLFDEVMEALQPHSPGAYIDGTVGAGGHAAGILERSAPDGRLLGIDRDARALEVARTTLQLYGPRAVLVQGSYAEMGELARRHGFYPADGVLLDLGLSSMQLADAARGFSFQAEGPLDMRFDLEAETTAAELVNHLPERELADLLYEYGEERRSRRIARAIVAARPITTTTQLAEVVAAAVGRRGKIHPATQTFQALRIAVNNELDTVAQGLEQALEVLRPGGRLAVISFHSLEDRIVKRYLREQARPAEGSPTVRLVTRKPLQASAEEMARNPRSRSAKLRVAEKTTLAESR